MKKVDKCATVRNLNMYQRQDVYLRESVKLTSYAPSIPLGEDGTVRYAARYSQRSSGYRRRVYAQGVALARAPRRLMPIE